MSTRSRSIGYAPTLSPFPEGWYFVASRQALRKAKLIQKTWMGQNVVIWCDDEGQVCVAEATCPHLGADLGPEAGARVCGGRLVCAFHDFEFDATGQCVATPYAEPPKTAMLRVLETKEVLGLVFAWWGIEGREPQWGLPADPPDRTCGALSRSTRSASRAIHRRRRRTLWTWATYATSTAMTA